MNKRAPYIVLIASAILIGLFFASLNKRRLGQQSQPKRDSYDRTVRISLLSYTTDTSTERVAKGFKDKLNELAPEIDWQIKEYWAKGDHTLLHAMTNELFMTEPDLVFTIGFAATQSIIKYRKKRGIIIPHTCSSVHEVLWYRLEEDYPDMSQFTTGCIGRDFWDMLSKILRRLLPHVKTVSISEPEVSMESAANYKKIESELIKEGINCNHVPVQTHSDTIPRMQKYLPTTDAFVYIRESMALNNRTLMINLANRNNIPLFAFDRDTIMQGALMGFGWDDHIGGRVAATQTVQIIKDKKDIADIPVVDLNQYAIQFFINKKSLPTQGAHINQPALYLIDRGFITHNTKGL